MSELPFRSIALVVGLGRLPRRSGAVIFPRHRAAAERGRGGRVDPLKPRPKPDGLDTPRGCASGVGQGSGTPDARAGVDANSIAGSTGSNRLPMATPTAASGLIGMKMMSPSSSTAL